jgi:hypothetical protein
MLTDSEVGNRLTEAAAVLQHGTGDATRVCGAADCVCVCAQHCSSSSECSARGADITYEELLAITFKSCTYSIARPPNKIILLLSCLIISIIYTFLLLSRALAFYSLVVMCVCVSVCACVRVKRDPEKGGSNLTLNQARIPVRYLPRTSAQEIDPT